MERTTDKGDARVPQRGEVLVRMHAVSWNYRDLMVTVGKYNPKMKLPRIHCSDGAGEVVAVGEGVPRVKVGDRVLFGKYGGTEVKIDGEDRLILREEDILGVIEGK